MNDKKKDGIKDFKLLSLKILDSCNTKVLKSLHPGEYVFNELELSEDFFAHHVNISAIVGMNGAGKSSLLELIFRMINNFSAYLVGNSMKRKGADVLYFVPGIQAELRYQMGGKQGVLYCHDRIVALKYGESKYLLSNHESYREEQFDGFEKCYKASFSKRRDIAKSFFYTVVMNYALQAYNSFDYQDENASDYMTINKIGSNSAGNWINSLFHKNDGYSSPIVLNPYRNEGVIDMKTETSLTRDRLSGILVEADKKKRELIDGYQLHLNTFCSFNILITTHSPFLLSDIPQSNVLYLENGSVAPKVKMQNPFAANVNDILYQSFFLSNGFMGEFAKQKIMKLISNKDKYDKQKARELIDLIGEPLLRDRLKDMWEENKL